ncbi:MAG TPA: DCC1-like thiol-disulfide oxidoreductase family protein [Frankiaceae bacterium]|jgi:predicted DCC family thiol-disulfide oxidoreductase YuxK|nr:DCC1-like thiol-disulfide oxidoreductase family protein [Frankiaceae bacterium]
MRSLTVLYDPTCSLCCKAAAWVSDQEKYLPVNLVAAGSPAARAAFPTIDHEATRNQLTVIGDGGEVYYDERGWLMVLWALRKYRAMAIRFSQPGMLPAAKRFVLWVSRHRETLRGFVP